MSTWRREASKRLPELQSIIASREVDNPMMLWIELHMKFDRLCAEPLPNMDLIKRIWRYAAWCMESSDDNVGTAAAFAFCEHLIDSKAQRSILPLIMSRKEFEQLKELLLYHNSIDEYEQALNQFQTN